MIQTSSTIRRPDSLSSTHSLALATIIFRKRKIKVPHLLYHWVHPNQGRRQHCTSTEIFPPTIGKKRASFTKKWMKKWKGQKITSKFKQKEVRISMSPWWKLTQRRSSKQQRQHRTSNKLLKIPGLLLKLSVLQPICRESHDLDSLHSQKSSSTLRILSKTIR